MRALVLLTIGFVALTGTSASAGTVRPLEDLLCSGVTVPIDLAEWPAIDQAGLHGNAFTAQVNYASKRPGVQQRLPPTLPKRPWIFSFELDNGPPTQIANFLATGHEAVTISFLNLRPGRHELRIGEFDPPGTWIFENRYCFSIPQSVKWKD
jgi:hypothetical protein